MRNSGFTIIELMVVIAIVAILALVTAPAMMNWRGTSSLRSAHLNMASDMRMAKLRAVRERAPVTVLFGATGYTIFLDNGMDAAGNVVQALRGNAVRDNPEPLLKGVTFEPPITATPDGAFNGAVSFNERGYSIRNGIPVTGEVTLSNGELDRVINVNVIGRITTP